MDNFLAQLQQEVPIVSQPLQIVAQNLLCGEVELTMVDMVNDFATVGAGNLAPRAAQ